jgi:hypothetical protein
MSHKKHKASNISETPFCVSVLFVAKNIFEAFYEKQDLNR